MIFRLTLSNFKFFFIRVMYGTSLSAKFPLLADEMPYITIKGAGFIHLSNARFRSGVRCIADGGRISFGNNCFINSGCSFNSLASIEIGDNVLFGEGVRIYDHNHLIDGNLTVKRNQFSTNSVRIGSGCWIGSNVVILSGVAICPNSIIGAGCIVTRDILSPGIYINKANADLTNISLN